MPMRTMIAALLLAAWAALPAKAEPAAPAPPPAPPAGAKPAAPAPPAKSAPSATDAPLTLGGVTLLQFRAAAGGFPPEQRRAKLESRIIEILSHAELGPDDVRVVPGPGGHSATIQVGPLLFVTATEADAHANQSTPAVLAAVWADNLRRGFAAAKPRPVPHPTH